LESAGDVDDFGNLHVRHGACRGLRGGPVERSRVPRLPDEPVGARGVDRTQDRTHVMRVLDAVEDDDEWRTRRAGDEVADIDRAGFPQLRDDTLVTMPRAAADGAIEIRGGHAPNGHAPALGRLRQL